MGLGADIMARMTIKGTDELAIQISRLETMSTEIAKDVVMAGAQPVADEIRKGLEKNLQGSKYSTGDLLDSLGIAPPDVDRNGNVNTKVGFDGYDRKGVPNIVKARVMESGSSKQKKRPFVRPAVNRSKQKAIEEMQKKLDEELKKIFK